MIYVMYQASLEDAVCRLEAHFGLKAIVIDSSVASADQLNLDELEQYRGKLVVVPIPDDQWESIHSNTIEGGVLMPVKVPNRIFVFLADSCWNVYSNGDMLNVRARDQPADTIVELGSFIKIPLVFGELDKNGNYRRGDSFYPKAVVEEALLSAPVVIRKPSPIEYERVETHFEINLQNETIVPGGFTGPGNGNWGFMPNPKGQELLSAHFESTPPAISLRSCGKHHVASTEPRFLASKILSFDLLPADQVEEGLDK